MHDRRRIADAGTLTMTASWQSAASSWTCRRSWRPAVPPIDDVIDHLPDFKRSVRLVLVPTTCGTGSRSPKSRPSIVRA